jgi:hypothetical protein
VSFILRWSRSNVGYNALVVGQYRARTCRLEKKNRLARTVTGFAGQVAVVSEPPNAPGAPTPEHMACPAKSMPPSFAVSTFSHCRTLVGVW